VKSFFLSLLLLALLICGVVWNYIYINDVFASMNTLLDALPEVNDPACPAACEVLSAEWKKHTDRVGLSVCFNVLDRVSEQVELLSVCASCGDRYGFEASRELLRDALDDIRRLERFSVGNLL
jgi:hypothetical protein